VALRLPRLARATRGDLQQVAPRPVEAEKRPQQPQLERTRGVLGAEQKLAAARQGRMRELPAWLARRGSARLLDRRAQRAHRVRPEQRELEQRLGLQALLAWRAVAWLLKQAQPALPAWRARQAWTAGVGLLAHPGPAGSQVAPVLSASSRARLGRVGIQTQRLATDSRRNPRRGLVPQLAQAQLSRYVSYCAWSSAWAILP
jgi:hypothetical protein